VRALWKIRGAYGSRFLLGGDHGAGGVREKSRKWLTKKFFEIHFHGPEWAPRIFHFAHIFCD
jgi:hypothetical protein